MSFVLVQLGKRKSDQQDGSSHQQSAKRQRESSPGSKSGI